MEEKRTFHEASDYWIQLKCSRQEIDSEKEYRGNSSEWKRVHTTTTIITTDRQADRLISCENVEEFQFNPCCCLY